MENENDIGEFFGAILQSRDITHLAHLKSSSYAEHVALDDYYNGIIPLVDDLIECYQGCYGKVNICICGSEAADPLQYLMDLKSYIMECKESCLSGESHLLNIVDEILALISKTIYKLKFLK